MTTLTGTIPWADVKVRDPRDDSVWSIKAEEASFIRDTKAGVVTLSIRMKSRSDRNDDELKFEPEHTAESDSSTVTKIKPRPEKEAVEVPAMAMKASRSVSSSTSPKSNHVRVKLEAQMETARPDHDQPPASVQTRGSIDSQLRNDAVWAELKPRVVLEPLDDRRPSRQTSYSPPRCEVRGCAKFSQGKINKDDAWGVRGKRCIRHGGGTRCNVPECGKFKVGVVKVADSWANPGPRCVQHGARWPRCNVVDCGSQKVGVVQENDTWGQAGFRCFRHGGRNK